MPDKPPEPDHFGVQIKSVGLVVQQRFDWSNVNRTDTLNNLSLNELRKSRKYGCLGFPSRCRGKDHGILTSQYCLAGQLLHRT